MTDITKKPEDEIEVVAAREAMLELLASTLDDALPLVTDRGRAERLGEIAAVCGRIGFLGEAAARLGGHPTGDVAAAWARLARGLASPT